MIFTIRWSDNHSVETILDIFYITKLRIVLPTDYNISERANTNEKITTYPLYKMSSRPTASLAKNQLRPGYWIKRIKLHGCSLGKKLSWTLLVVCSPTLFFFLLRIKKITAITKLYLSAVVISARLWKPRKGNRDNYRTWRKEEETWATGNQPKKNYRDQLLRDHKIHGWRDLFPTIAKYNGSGDLT